jgi:broad specificity phosphatase PhoE
MKMYRTPPALIVLVRHAESVGNTMTADERAKHPVSSCHYSITPRGIAQAQQTGAYVRERFGEFDAYYSSYYTRTRETFAHLYPTVTPIVDPRLAEAQRGIYHINTTAEIEKHYPGELLRKEQEGKYHYRPPGGENWPDIELRIRSFLETLREEHAGQRVLLVIHGHWLVLFQRLVQNLSIEEAFRRYEIEGPAENASVTVFEGLADEDAPVAGCRFGLKLVEENIVPWRV